jgi:hypothetical protein
MTNKRTFTILTVLFLAVVPNLHATKCSNAFLKGTYAYSSQGFIQATPDISPAGFVPWIQTGVAVYDGHGNILSGTFTVTTTTANNPEGSFRGTLTGTYTVNRDCTGTVQVDLGDGTLFNFDLVVQGPEKHTYTATDPGFFLSVYSFQKVVGEKETAETQ